MEFQGYLDAQYDELCILFGAPVVFSGEGKVDAEWTVPLKGGGVATIYNWKNGRNYLGDEGRLSSDITRWHIGGERQEAAIEITLMVEQFREQLKRKAKTSDPLINAKQHLLDAVDACDDMMGSVAAIKGQDFALSVECGMQALTMIELNAVMTDMLKSTGMPEEIVKRLKSAHANGLAQLMAAAMKGLCHETDDSKVTEYTNEVLDWATKMRRIHIKAAQAAADTVMKGT